jgi:hypothetical protein
MNLSLDVYFWSYLVVFTGHFLYALMLGKSFKEQLYLFNINSLTGTLVGLTLINLPSITIFLIDSYRWFLANILLHIILLFDELIRTLNYKIRRWPFIFFHLLFVLVMILSKVG